MRKIYHLKTCDTNRRIIKELQIPDTFEFQEIKKNPITEAQLDEMKSLSGSYESLFSKRSRQYKALGLKDIQLKENDYKKYILEHYSFLKRPVLIVDDQIFIGNSKNTIEAAKSLIASL